MDAGSYGRVGDASVSLFKVIAASLIASILSCGYFAAASFGKAPKLWEYKLKVEKVGK